MATVQQAIGWIQNDLARFSSAKNFIDVSERNYPPGTTVTLYTDTNKYSITLTDTYMGCIASSRKSRAGEDWTRGNDLPDGPLSQETWISIMGGIISYELVKIVKTKSTAIPDNA